MPSGFWAGANPALSILAIVRGLGYYTGTVFETVSEDAKIGSVCSGGRYDKVIGALSGRNIPAVGISLGIERIIDIIASKKELGTAKADAFVATVQKELAPKAVMIAESLRRKGLRVETDLMERNFSNQLKYANKIGAKQVYIIGEKDLAEGNITVKDMEQGTDSKVSVKSLI